MTATPAPIATIPAMNLPWVESPFFERHLAASDLDAQQRAQVRFFAEHGYLILDAVLDGFDATADRVVTDLAPRYEGERRLQDAWVFNEDVKRIASSERVLETLRLLYRREPIPFQTLNFPVGTQQKTHSDTIHFHSVPQRFMCGVWVALEDIDAENGPLHYYPGSHKLPAIDYHDMGMTDVTPETSSAHYQRYEGFIAQMLESLGLDRREIQLKKGQALIWAANLYHGGSPILDPSRSRHSQVTHYYFSDCLYYTPMYSDPFKKRLYVRRITDIRTGQTVPHAYNGAPMAIEDQVESVPHFVGKQVIGGLLSPGQKAALKRVAARFGLGR